MERRIAAILAADMVGFSRLVELDEAGTLERQKQHRLELIDPTFRLHGGSIIKLTGDGLLAEFSSVVEAIQAALHVQKEMTSREVEVPEDRRIQYRVAVHLGDVIFDEGDIYGDGVNVAARLESLAEPGGVVISGPVYDMLKAQVNVGYRSLGEKRLKNIEKPVRVFELTDTPQRIAFLSRSFGSSLRVGVLVLIAVGIVGLSWTRPDFSPVDPKEMALMLPQNPSIAVMPFELRGNPGENDWVADGITESIIATLSLAPELVVIGRSTMFSFKGRQASAAEVAQELGVRYVLSGSVTVTGDQLRVAAELADALAGNVLWARREDNSTRDLMAVQDEISEHVFEEMSVALTEGEGARSWIKAAGGFQNYVKVVKGRSEFQKFTPEGHANAARIWGKLHQEFPENAFNVYLIGFLHWQKVIIGISEDPASDWAEAGRLARKALEIEEFGEGYTLLAYFQLGNKNYDEAIKYADMAIEISPGSADANSIGGLIKAVSGQTKEGLGYMEAGMRLEPDYPDWLPAPVNFARIQLREYDRARELALQVLASKVEDVRARPRALGALIAINVIEGDMDAARAWADELKSDYPEYTVAHFDTFYRLHKYRDFVEKYLTALETAGVPKE